MAHELATKPYADFSWYTDEYKGTLLTAATFPRNARWASNLIDTVTYGNIDSNDKVSDSVKDACCAAAELAYNYYRSTVSAEEGRGKKSESNDGYSISYDDTLSTAESLQKECLALIRVYLQNSGLLFRGVRRRRCCPW